MEQKWKISKAQKRQRNARTKEEASVSTHALVAHTRRRVCFYVFLLVLLILSLKNRIIILFHLLSLSLSLALVFYDVDALFVSRPSAFFMYSPFPLSFSLSFSLFLSLSFTHSLVHLLNKLPPLSPCLHLINTKNVYSTPSILSSTSMYNCRKRSMFSSLVSQ
jgi:hypothetical protein